MVSAAKLKCCCRDSCVMIFDNDVEAKAERFFISAMAEPTLVNVTGRSTKLLWELLVFSPSSIAAEAMATVNFAASVEPAC